MRRAQIVHDSCFFRLRSSAGVTGAGPAAVGLGSCQVEEDIAARLRYSVRVGRRRLWLPSGGPSRDAQRLPAGSDLQFVLAGVESGSHRGCRSRNALRVVDDENVDDHENSDTQYYDDANNANDEDGDDDIALMVIMMMTTSPQAPIFSSRWRVSIM